MARVQQLDDGRLLLQTNVLDDNLRSRIEGQLGDGVLVEVSGRVRFDHL